jgi:hypothetical protein
MTATEVIGIVAIAIPVAVVVAELIARQALGSIGGYFCWWPGRSQRFHLDSESLPMLPDVVNWIANEDGERGGTPPAKGESCYRVLLAGGSCVEGYYLDQPETVVGQLEASLSEAGGLQTLGTERVHVGGVARSRISCAQIQTLLEKTLPRYESLDCLVLMVGASNLVRWLELKTPPAPWNDDVPLSHLFECHPKGPFAWHPKRTALRALAVRLHGKLRPRVEVRTGVGKRIVQQRARRQAARVMLDECPDPIEMIDQFADELGRLIDFAKTKAKKVVVVRQPCFDKPMTKDEEKWMWNFAQGVIYASDVDTYYSHRLIAELMQKTADRCGEVTRAHGAIDVDLSSTVEAGLENYYDFLHFTPKGAERVARRVAREITG